MDGKKGDEGLVLGFEIGEMGCWGFNGFGQGGWNGLGGIDGRIFVCRKMDFILIVIFMWKLRFWLGCKYFI